MKLYHNLTKLNLSTTGKEGDDEIMNERFLKAQSILLFVMIITMPITMLPERYILPKIMKNVPSFILMVNLLVMFFSLRTTSRFSKVDNRIKKILFLIILWPLVCTIHGFLTFPYWNNEIDQAISDSSIINFLAKHFSFILNSSFLHLKLFLSYTWNLFKDCLFPLIGIPAIIIYLYSYKKERVIDFVSDASFALALLFSLYSFIEIIWLWTGFDICKAILIFINTHLYDPATTHGWWPKLIYTNQLRSFAFEPAFFGIYALFLIPILWYRIWGKRNVKEIPLLFFFMIMLYMTNARTANVFYLCEIVLLIIASYFSKNNRNIKATFKIVALSLVSFSIVIICNSVLPLYFQKNIVVEDVNFEKLTTSYVDNNITSVGKLNKRSNTARYGNTIAMFKIGLHHPVFGVGTKLFSPYMVEEIPSFAINDKEINLWKNMMEDKTFIKSSFPILNYYAAIYSQYGTLGLLLFLLPSIYLLKMVIFNRAYWLGDFRNICITIAFLGQLACLMSNNLFYVYPISLGLMFCCHKQFLAENSNS